MRKSWLMAQRACALRTSWKALWLPLVPVAMMLAADSARIEKTVNTTPNPRIILNNTTGQIVIRGWSRAQVHALYTPSSPQVEVDTSVLPTGSRAAKIHFYTPVLHPLAPGQHQRSD